MLMWAGPEITSFRSWRLCVTWCVWGSWSVGASAKLCRCGVSWEGAVVDLLGLISYHSFLVPHCPLCMLNRIVCHTKTSLLLSFVPIFRCKTWFISRIRFSTWNLHLWFRKPLTEAKDSLCGDGENVYLCGPGNPHNWWLALAPSFPPHPSFFL